jgi:hypothetical protein
LQILREKFVSRVKFVSILREGICLPIVKHLREKLVSHVRLGTILRDRGTILRCGSRRGYRQRAPLFIFKKIFEIEIGKNI